MRYSDYAIMRRQLINMIGLAGGVGTMLGFIVGYLLGRFG